MTIKPVKISNNCWKHTYKNGDFIYTKTYDIISERHREDGPACEYSNGDKEWYINGKCHRLDGPAVEFACGSKNWYYNGKFIDVNSQEEFELYLKNIVFI